MKAMKMLSRLFVGTVGLLLAFSLMLVGTPVAQAQSPTPTPIWVGPNIELKGQMITKTNAVLVTNPNTVIVGGDNGILATLDLTDLTKPRVIGSLKLPDIIWSIQRVGNLLYIPASGKGLRIVDNSNPATPKEIGFYDTPGVAAEVVIQNNLAFLADEGSGLKIIDVSTPTLPKLVGVYNTQWNEVGIQVAGNYAYTSGWYTYQCNYWNGWIWVFQTCTTGGVEVIDVSNPAKPTLVSRYVTKGGAYKVKVIDNLIYLMDRQEGLRIIDATDPANLTLVGNYDTYDALDVEVVDGYAYVTDNAAGLKVIDVHDPTKPTLAAAYDTSSGSGYKVAVANGLIYQTDRAKGLFILKAHLEPTLKIVHTVSKEVVSTTEKITYTVKVDGTGLTQTLNITVAVPFGVIPQTGTYPKTVVYDKVKNLLTYKATPPVNHFKFSYVGNVDKTKVGLGSSLYSRVTAKSGGLMENMGAYSVIANHAVRSTLLLVYTVVDNNLGDKGKTQVNELEEGLCEDPFKAVFMMLDGPKEEDSYYYLLHCDKNPASPNYDIREKADGTHFNGSYIEGVNMWKADESSTTDYAFAAFLDQALLTYPQIPNINDVVLILAGHGNAPFPNILSASPNIRGGQPGGFLIDQHPSESSMSLDILGKGLAMFKQKTGKVISLLYLDACAMSNAEVYAELYPYVKYVVASAGLKWDTFQNYHELLQLMDTTSPLSKTATLWIDSNSASLIPDGYPFADFAGDLSHYATLQSKLDAFAQVALPFVSTKTGHEKFRLARPGTACIDNTQDGVIDEQDTTCDIGSFMVQVQQQFKGNTELVNAAQAVINALAAMTLKEAHQSGTPYIYQRTEPWVYSDPFSGVTIFLPLGAKDAWQRGLYNGNNFAFAKNTHWDEFINAYWRGITAPEFSCSTQNCNGLPNGWLEPASLTLALSNPSGNTMKLSWVTALSTTYNLKRWISGLLPQTYQSNVLNGIFEDTLPSDEQTYCYQLEAKNTENVVITSNIQCTKGMAPQLVIADQNGAKGTKILSPISLHNAKGVCISAASFTQLYNPAILRPTGYVSATAFTQGYTFKSSTSITGQVRIATYNANCTPLYGSGELFWIEYEVVGQIGQVSPLEFMSGLSNTVIYSGTNITNPLEFIPQQGQFTVNGECVRGDANCKDGINAADALFAVWVASKLITPTVDQITACDVNGNGGCGSADALLILCYTVNLDWNKCGGVQTRSRLVNSEPVRLCTPLVEGQVNEVIDLPVHITPNSGVYGGDLVLNYNTNSISIEGVNSTPLVGGVVAANTHEAGIIRLSFADEMVLASVGTLFNLKIRLKQPRANLTMSEVSLYDVNGQDFVTNLQRQIETSVCASMNEIYLPLITR